MANYEKARVKLTNIQRNRLNSAAKSKTGITLRITKKASKTNNCLMNYL